MNRRRSCDMKRGGATAIVAMLCLVVFASLAFAMFSVSSLGIQSANNYSNVESARAAAESGMRWMEYRFKRMKRPRTTIGVITPQVARNMWPSLRQHVIDDLNTLFDPAERPDASLAIGVTTPKIAIDQTDARFVLEIAQDSADPRYVHVTSTGEHGTAKRSVHMKFRIDKKVRFAIAGKVPIQLGRNVIVEGPIANVTGNRYPPLLTLSDFRHLTPELGRSIDTFNAFLEKEHNGYDNRIRTDDTAEYSRATDAGFRDVNGDSFIDEYDLFVDEFDSNKDGGVDRGEFTDPRTGKMYDGDLFNMMDTLAGPHYTGDPSRAGYNDGVIDNRDGYAKVRGQVNVAATEPNWSRNAGSGNTIYDQLRGPVSTDAAITPPVKFAATANETVDLAPQHFDTSVYENRTGPTAGNTVRTPTAIENAVLSASDANGGVVNEGTPYGSTSIQATYKRPVFRNMTFKNVRIPKGLNALFDNCKFEGITHVDLETRITNAGGQITTNPGDAGAWARRMKKGNFDPNKPLDAANSHGFEQGNNLRFNDTVFEGPITSDVPTAYTHFANSWEFTNSTYFNNKVDNSATIIAPQTNIEMGSFTDPGSAPSTLVGVVVAGNIDIRGVSTVDGSIIVTGDGAANTTLGWFGPSDGSTDPNAPIPGNKSGTKWGKLNLRYNPSRPLPDGINMMIEVLAVPDTYEEGM